MIPPYRFLPGGYKIHQQFFRDRLPHQKMPQKSGVPQPVIVRDFTVAEVIRGNGKHPVHVSLADPAFRGIYDIVKTVLFMEAQRKRSLLIFVSKGKFHLVPIMLPSGTFCDPLIHRKISLFSRNGKQQIPDQVLL